MNKIKLTTVAAIICSLSCTFGFAACDFGRGEQENPNIQQNPNYRPNEDADLGELEYELSEDGRGYVLVGIGMFTDTSITIPSTFNGLPVIGIADEAFFGNSELTLVGIGENVEYIGESAFYLCTELTSIRIPASVKEIGKDAFAYCSALRVVSFAEDSQITKITYGTFQNCESLYSVSFPDSIQVIGTRAFQYCTSLRNVTIGNGVRRIKTEAFRGCSALTYLTFGNSLSIIEEKAFQRCTALNNLVLPQTLSYIGKYALSECDSLTKLTIPFVGSGTAASSIPNDYVGDDIVTSSFDYSNAFSHIFGTVPSSLKELTVVGGRIIGTLAFVNCRDLECIKIGSGVTSLGLSVFNFCNALNTVILSSSIAVIDEAAFYQTPALRTVYYEGSVAQWQNISILIHNDYLRSASIYFYSEEQPTESGNFWHYVDDVPTIW